MSILGIDLGGTKTSVSMADENGSLLHAVRSPTDCSAGFERWLETVEHMSTEVLSSQSTSLDQVKVIGLSAPGPLSVASGSLIAPPNMPGWVDIPIVEALAKAFGKPVFMNNDANAAALAEWQFGSYKGASDLVYITLSTGVGAGVIANGQLVQGVCDMGGEVGHHTLDIHGPPCPCGRRGCFEIYCGGKNVADRVRERILKDEIETNILDEAGGDPERIDFKCITEAVEMKDTFALEVWEEFTERLAQGLGNIIQMFNPRAILLGTIALHTGDLLMVPLRNKLPRYTWKEPREACAVEPTALGSQIGDYGAIAVALQG